VNTITFALGSVLLAADAAVIPAAPEPMTIMFFGIFNAHAIKTLA
jgi:hypothetical protein